MAGLSSDILLMKGGADRLGSIQVSEIVFFSANERSKGEGKGKEEEGKEKGKGKLEVKLWQKRKKSQTPQPGIEPGTPANAADALGWLGRLRFFPFLPKLHF